MRRHNRRLIAKHQKGMSDAQRSIYVQTEKGIEHYVLFFFSTYYVNVFTHSFLKHPLIIIINHSSPFCEVLEFLIGSCPSFHTC